MYEMNKWGKWVRAACTVSLKPLQSRIMHRGIFTQVAYELQSAEGPEVNQLHYGWSQFIVGWTMCSGHLDMNKGFHPVIQWFVLLRIEDNLRESVIQNADETEKKYTYCSLQKWPKFLFFSAPSNENKTPNQRSGSSDVRWLAASPSGYKGWENQNSHCRRI